MINFDREIENLKQGKILSEEKLRRLCQNVKEILLEESNVQPVSSPVIVCGDIHGQYYDLLELFRIGGDIPNNHYIFMGDFVDRGYHSIETLQLLLLYKARYPDCITLLRGNHESRQVTHIYGFYAECLKKYDNANIWCYCVELFDYFGLAALIDGQIFCVHGGLSPQLPTIDQIRLLERKQEIPASGSFSDLVWSDPEDIETWVASPRGAGWLFGSKVANEFSHLNDLELICRAHQLVNSGYEYKFQNKILVTIWSAPNYCYRCGNVASILEFDDYLNRQILIFKEVEKSRMLAPEVAFENIYSFYT